MVLSYVARVSRDGERKRAEDWRITLTIPPLPATGSDEINKLDGRHVVLGRIGLIGQRPKHRIQIPMQETAFS